MLLIVIRYRGGIVNLEEEMSLFIIILVDVLDCYFFIIFLFDRDVFGF